MKVIDVEQGSPEWLAWRKTVITATECPVILGLSPWSTPYKCWQKKLGLIEGDKTNDAMERGKRLEPYIRQRFIDKYGINMTPIVVESTEYPFLGASLDGISDDGKYILEVKTGGEKLYLMALEGKLPHDYLLQIQKQLFVTKAEKCFYVVGGEEEDKDVVIEIFLSPEFEAMYLPVARAFWKNIVFMEPPALQDRDYKDMNDNDSWKYFAEKYASVCEEISTREELKEGYRKELLKLCGDQSCLGAGIRVMKTTVKGRVAYDDIPEIKDIDLEKYRKPSSTSWRFLVV